MILLFVLIVAILAVVFLLKGEGESYGKGNAGSHHKKSFTTSDKTFFL